MDESTQAFVQKLQSLKLTRSDLGKTLRFLKSEQESLQTAVKDPSRQSETTCFRLVKLKQHGKGSLAYSSLQPGLKYFHSEELGYVAYTQLSSPDSVLVLADPICATENACRLIDEFLKAKKDPIFLHVSYPIAQILNSKGFHVNELGVETIVSIQEFTLTGNKKQQLRNARNGGKKDNLEVMEVTSVQDPIFKALKGISDEWIKEKVASSSDMQFLVRPIVYVDEIDVRKFIAVKDGHIVGFVIFDPMYENGQVTGYIANQLRSNLDRTYSVTDYIILEAMEKFKAEGKKDLSLGLSPLAKVDDTEEFRHSKLLKTYFQYSFEKANFLYNFKNLARHKSKYRPELPGAREEKVYCAAFVRMVMVRMVEVCGVLGLHPVRETLKHLWKTLVEKITSLFTRTSCEQQASNEPS